MKTMAKSDDMIMRSHRVRGGAGSSFTSTKPATRRGGRCCSSTAFRNAAWPGAGNSRPTSADDLRLVAMDLRGHGLSDRPTDGYGDPVPVGRRRPRASSPPGSGRPILCGWSYGGVVIGDYLRHYGEQAIGGICLVGAVSRLGESVMPFLGPEFVATLPGLFSDDVDERGRPPGVHPH